MPATFPTHAVTRLRPRIYSSTPATPLVLLACAHSALSQPDRSALARCASSTNASPISPLDSTLTTVAFGARVDRPPQGPAQVSVITQNGVGIDLPGF